MLAEGRNLNITQISRESGMSQSYLSTVFSWWKECGIIIKDKEIGSEGGQSTKIDLSEFGREAFRAFERFAQVAERAKQNRDRFMEDHKDES